MSEHMLVLKHCVINLFINCHSLLKPDNFSKKNLIRAKLLLMQFGNMLQIMKLKNIFHFSKLPSYHSLLYISIHQYYYQFIYHSTMILIFIHLVTTPSYFYQYLLAPLLYFIL